MSSKLKVIWSIHLIAALVKIFGQNDTKMVISFENISMLDVNIISVV